MSFGLRRGRTLEFAGYGLTMADLPPFEEGRLDPRAWFDEPGRPFEIEIGSGKGTFLVQQGDRAPETNYLGIEWAGEFFRYAADRIRRREMKNVKLLHADAVEFLTHWVEPDIARVIHLYFSDPWPKSKHHKRRVVQDHSLREFHRVLREGGELRLVTDHDDLWAWYEAHAARNEAMFERLPFAAPDSAGEGELVGTNYERKFTREGRPFHAMTLKKRG